LGETFGERLAHFRVYSHVKVDSLDETKLREWSEGGRLLGYEEGTKGWKILLGSGKIVVRYNVKFIETP
jgi:hypothetical protein